MKVTLTFDLTKFKGQTEPTVLEWDTAKDHGPPIPAIGDEFFKSTTMRGIVKKRTFDVVGWGADAKISIWLEIE